MGINKRENDAVMNASAISECIWKGPAQDQREKITKPEVSAPHLFTLCYLPPLGILQAVLKSVAVAAVYYISLAVPRVSHADCRGHFLIYHDETMHKLVLTMIRSFFISTLLMSQTWDFQHFQG